MPSPRCPCCSGLRYDECCGPYHRGDAAAPTAEALMRSRFSAFAQRNEEYLLATWSAGTRPEDLNLDQGVRWTRLEVLATTGGSLFDSKGTVLFEAHFRDGARAGVMRENSEFLRENGKWRYVGATGE